MILKNNEEFTLKVLRNIEKTQSQKSLAAELGYSVGKINYVLKALIDKGLIKAENFMPNKNKRQYRYLFTPDGMDEKIVLTQKFIKRKKPNTKNLKKS